MAFTCSICGEPSTQICARCTKDTCGNHLCEKCLCCSDCCECELALDEPPHAEPLHTVFQAPGPEPEPAAPAEGEPDS